MRCRKGGPAILKKNPAKTIAFGAAALLLTLCCFFGFDLRLAVRTYRLSSEEIQSPVRLALITDLHGCSYGAGQQKLIQALAEQAPDLVCLAGDIVDESDPYAPAALELLDGIGQAYPCYYASGNHDRTQEWKDRVAAYGIKALAGETVTLTVGGQELTLAGVDDPAAFWEGNASGDWQSQLDLVSAKKGEGYSILLSHRPERTEAYQSSGFDLVLSGHAHGGQVRIPGLVNGVFAPHQGLFPKYAGGLYDLGGYYLLVSRGLSKRMPPRIFNRPELVILDLIPAEPSGCP